MQGEIEEGRDRIKDLELELKTKGWVHELIQKGRFS